MFYEISLFLGKLIFKNQTGKPFTKPAENLGTSLNSVRISPLFRQFSLFNRTLVYSYRDHLKKKTLFNDIVVV